MWHGPSYWNRGHAVSHRLANLSAVAHDSRAFATKDARLTDSKPGHVFQKIDSDTLVASGVCADGLNASVNPSMFLTNAYEIYSEYRLFRSSIKYSRLNRSRSHIQRPTGPSKAQMQTKRPQEIMVGTNMYYAYIKTLSQHSEVDSCTDAEHS